MKYLALLDCNNFFVSCERLFRPDLLGKPVVVLSSNDGCVIARSKEIKDKGIPMGVPYFQIKDTLKEIKGIVFSSHLALYRDISRRVFEVVRVQFPDLELYSIDECFLSFESERPEEVALSLKREVERLVGVPVSVGVAFSKTQAKYQNTIAKKTNGVAVLSQSEWMKESTSIRLSEIWGVGPNRFREFSSKGVITVADLLAMAQSDVGRLFGLEGVRLQGELKGENVFALEGTRPLQKSIMNTRSFGDTCTDINVLENAIKYHVFQGVKDLETMGLLATSLRVMLAPSRHGDFALHGASSEATFSSPTGNLFLVQKVALELLLACYKKEIPYKKAGVILSGLVKKESKTLSLFSFESDQKDLTTNLLSQTILAINKKHGQASLQLGFGRESNKVWQGRSSALSPSYTTKWTELRIVRS